VLEYAQVARTAETPPLLDIVDREINDLARKAKGFARI
jgi:hypothetical protein